MWIFSKYGFFSVVRVTEKHHPDEAFQVRARNSKHLDRLLAAIGISKDIIQTDEADYRFRIIVSVDELSEIMRCLEKSIDYTNFKDAAADSEDEDWNEALGNIWVRMVAYQSSQSSGKTHN